MFGYDFNQVLQLAGYKSLTEFEKSEILLKFPEVHRKHNSGPPRPIFGRQGLHSGGHMSRVPPLPLSNLQNPGKAQALGPLPAVAPLKHSYHSNFSQKSVKQMFETKTAKLISKRKSTSVHRKKNK